VSTDDDAPRGVTSRRGYEAADAIVIATDDPLRTLGEVRASTPLSERSASAVLWSITGESSGRPLASTNVLASVDPDSEQGDVFEDQVLPHAPTITLTTPARGTFLLHVMAPPRGELARDEDTDTEALRKLEAHVMHRLHDAGIRLRIFGMRRDDPTTLLHRGPGGCLHGPAFHGMLSPLRRLPARAPRKHLYYAGLACHPGPSLTMLAQSGRLAARAIVDDMG
jgi:1-hydroxycarotenoid 3,4-desaturase